MLKGTLVKGHRVASGTAPGCQFPDGSIKPQLKQFRNRGLPVQGLFAGTLNIDFCPFALKVSAHQFVLSDVTWGDGHTETFGLTPVRIKAGPVTVGGYLYESGMDNKTTLHEHKVTVSEFLAPPITNAKYGSRLSVCFCTSRDVVVRKSTLPKRRRPVST